MSHIKSNKMIPPNPFMDKIGLKFNKVENGFSQCSLTAKKELFNPHNVLHGGILYSMADTGMGAAVYPGLEKNELCATIEIKINYTRIVSSGILICNSQVLHKGKKTAVIESKIYNKIDESENLVAIALGTYSIFQKRIE